MKEVSSKTLKKRKKNKKKYKGGKRTKTTTIRNNELWKLKDGLPYNIKDNGESRNIGKKTDGYNSLFMGKFPIRNATRDQKFLKAPYYSSIFYNKYKRLFDKYEIDVDKCVISKGCWETNRHTLQSQLIPPKTGWFSNVDESMNISFFDKAAKNILRKLPISILPKCKKEDMLYSTFNTKTQPGLRYSECMFKKTKKEALYDAIKIASRRWDVIEKGGFKREDIIPGFFQIGARNKRDHTYEELEEATSRVVHMPEFHTELTSAPWMDQITNYLKEIQVGPVYIGHSFIQFERYLKTLEKYISAVEGDWKKFDSTLYLIIIICSLSILRCFYDLEDEEIDNHFIAIFDNIGIKDYYTPGGVIVRAFHGLPSGVKSTNLQGSICNLLALDVCNGNLGSKRRGYITGGDDFVFGLVKKIKKFSRWCKKFCKRAEYIGMNVKFLKQKNLDSEDLEEKPVFYKYTILDRSLPVIPVSSLLERVFMPWNKNYHNVKALYKFLNDVMPSLGAPGTHLLIYYLFYGYIYKIRFRRMIKIQDVIKRHIKCYNDLMFRGSFKDIRATGEFSIPFSCLSNIDTEEKYYITDIRTFSRNLVHEKYKK